MLAGVLLHMIEPARPINVAFHVSGDDRGLDDVSDPVTLINHLIYRDAGDGAAVKRLSAGRRVKRGAIQVYTLAGGFNHPRVKFC